MTERTDIIDTQSRDRILHDLETNFLVEAAAGTGKTTSIVGRMVNLVATGKCEIDHLAAMTFTRKAASELRERFQIEMRLAESNRQRSDEQRARLRGALDRMEEAFVGTFHSFCAMLLRERPIEAGVDPEFRELQETENNQLINEGWKAFLNQLHDGDDDCLQRIRDYGLNTADLKSCFEKFVYHPDVEEWPHQSPPAMDVEVFKDSLGQYVAHIESISESFPKDRGTDQLMDRYERAVRKSQHIRWDRLGDVFELAELFDSKHRCTLKWWSDPKAAKRERDRYDAFSSSTIKPALRWWYGYRYQFVISVLQRAFDVFEAMRRQSRGLNFENLLLKTAQSLKTQPELRAYFQRRFSCLLVDEFQDTDPIQAEILAFLTSSDHSEQVWHQCQPRPASLFLVGDPKQSIYRFRRADIVTYTQMKAMFQQGGGETLPLLKNFRSVGELREWNNDTFEQLFGSAETVYSPAAAAMLQGRVNVVDGQLAALQCLTIPAVLNRDDAIAHEAKQIASYIRGAIDSHWTVPRTREELNQCDQPRVQPGDFLIMAWKKDDLQYYAAALDRLDVPNEVSGSNAFKTIEELRILTDCLKTVDDFTNPIPYVALLRGGVFGFSDLDLYKYKKAGGRFSYRSLPEELEPELRLRFQRVHERLQTYVVWLRGLPFASAVERIAADLGLIARTAACAQGNVAAGGFLKAIEWIRAQSWDFDSAGDMIGYLEDLTENIESEPVAAMPPAQSLVRVMNLHKVKGLEASIVFLAGVFGHWRFSPHFHVDRRNHKTNGYFSITKPYGKHQTRPIAQPDRWDEVAAEELRFDREEKKRLLYVATTRAKSQLIVSRREGDNKSSRWQELDPFLKNASELQIHPIRSLPPRVKTEVSPTAIDLDERWERLQQPSYAVIAAKQLSLKGKTRPNWQASGEYGQAWGSVVHELLETKMRRPQVDLRPRAELLAAEYEIPHRRVEELLSTVQCVVGSEIWQRALSATNRYIELPFDLPASFEDKPAIVRGVIDLLFEEASGWVIVDYKTDDISPAQAQDAVDYYRGQLDTYAAAWRAATEMTVVETGLFFTRLNQYHRIE